MRARLGNLFFLVAPHLLVLFVLLGAVGGEAFPLEQLLVFSNNLHGHEHVDGVVNAPANVFRLADSLARGCLCGQLVQVLLDELLRNLRSNGEKERERKKTVRKCDVADGASRLTCSLNTVTALDLSVDSPHCMSWCLFPALFCRHTWQSGADLSRGRFAGVYHASWRLLLRSLCADGRQDYYQATTRAGQHNIQHGWTPPDVPYSCVQDSWCRGCRRGQRKKEGR